MRLGVSLKGHASSYLKHQTKHTEDKPLIHLGLLHWPILTNPKITNSMYGKASFIIGKNILKIQHESASFARKVIHKNDVLSVTIWLQFRT